MSSVPGWLVNAWGWLSALLPGNNEILKAAVLAIVGALAVWFARRLVGWFSRAIKRIGRDDYRWRVERARSAIRTDGPGLWLAINRELPSSYDLRMSAQPRVMVVANHKGGVGKTTITANLASAFARRLSKPVLAIDLDPQGSLGPLMFAGSKWRPSATELSAASQAVLASQSAANLANLIKPFTHIDRDGRAIQTPNAEGLPAFYDLSMSEDRGLVEWLIGDRLRDVRYDLFELLNGPAVRDRFGLIIIDAPPRTTLASIQALCAGTHVLIPTVLDDTSANAVGYFATHLDAHRKIWPKLRIIGILGSMSGDAPSIEPTALKTSGDTLRTILSRTECELRHIESLGYDFEIPYELAIKNQAAIAKASERGIAYDVLVDSAGGADVRTMFDNLARDIEGRMK